MLEGGCAECSRWKTREEMWKITYQFMKWLDSSTMFSVSLSLHLSKKCQCNKILFPPMNLLILLINKSQFSFIFSTNIQPRLSAPYSHSTCAHLPPHWSKCLFHFALMVWCRYISYQKGSAYLLVYTPVQVASVCDNWYAPMASLFSTDVHLRL